MTSNPEWFEDLYVGHQVRAMGESPVTEQQIIEFAQQFDPLDFHTDVEAAKQGLFGELVASGVHTLSLTNVIRLKSHGPLRQIAGMGIDKLRMSRPLYPGDIISIIGECIEHHAGHRQDAGVVTYQYRALNQKSEVVLSYNLRFLVSKQPGN